MKATCPIFARYTKPIFNKKNEESEPICRVLQIAPSTCYSHAAREADPKARPNRWWRDRTLDVEVRRVWEENKQVYGAKKVWKQLLREGWQVARCTVERLMRRMGLRGVIRGKVVKTTTRDQAEPPRLSWRPFGLSQAALA